MDIGLREVGQSDKQVEAVCFDNIKHSVKHVFARRYQNHDYKVSVLGAPSIADGVS